MKKLTLVAWLIAGGITALFPLYLFLKSAGAPNPAPLVVANISENSSPAVPGGNGNGLSVNDSKETLDSKTALPPVRELLNPSASDGKEMLPPDGKETLDAKKEILEPVGEMIGPASNAINLPPGVPAVELLNTPNPFNTHGPVVSPETR